MLHKKSEYVGIGDGLRIKVGGIGDVELSWNGGYAITLRNCMYVPELGDVSLVSIRKCQKNGFYIIGLSDTIEVTKPDGKVLCFGKDVGNGLFELQLYPTGSEPPCTEVSSEHTLPTYKEWHIALWHPTVIDLKLYADGNLISAKPADFHCKEYALAKSTYRKPPRIRFRHTRPLELIYTDLSSKFSCSSLRKGLYYMTFIDDCARYAWVRILKSKDEATEVMRDFITTIECQFDTKIARFKCDGGGKYINKVMETMISKIGIVIEVIPPYSDESNGTAERFNRNIKDIVRTSLLSIPAKSIDLGRYYFLWAEAVCTAIYAKNCLPNRSFRSQITPFQRLFGRKPYISHMRAFGVTCYTHIAKESRPAGTQLHLRAL